MASLLRKLRPAAPPVPDDDKDYSFSFEYSFAVEYHGPPLGYSIPEAAPFKIDQIPVAAVAPSPEPDHISVPIIQPIVKTKKKVKLCKDSTLSSVELADSVSALETSCSIDHNLASLVCADEADECTANLSQKLPTSFRVSGCSEILQEPSVNSGMLEKPDDDKQDSSSRIEISPTNCDTTESASSSRTVSSNSFSCREDDCIDETPSPRHRKRPSIVTFRDPEINDVEATEEYDYSQAGTSGTSPVRPRAERNGKRGTCYRCNKGNRFTEKEVCIVCNAKYCRNCVLRVMGSMPEGRKCVTCISYRIDENERGRLGKCSRMLKGMLSEEELKERMHSEMFCEANQIPAKLVIVNKETLDQKQIMLLLRCSNPPKKLKPGAYWYDKASGFWGKEGREPSQLISPQLDVGGHLKKDASCGNTNVIINGREITKRELSVLKWVGVPCEGTPNFWLSQDGSYQEEGQNNIIGKIWDKRWKRLFYAIQSLPTPPSSVIASSDSVEGENKVTQDNLEEKRPHKLLLVGSIKSGSSTIFKQAKILYNGPFSDEERQDIKLVIQSNLYAYIGILLEGREQFEEESLMQEEKKRLNEATTSSGNTSKNSDTTTIYSIGQRLKAFSDWLIKYMVSGNLDTIFPAATREYAPLIEELWKDAAIQATYDRRNELKMLPRAATYFLDRAVEISKIDYEPSDMDIMYAEGITLSKSLTSMEFLFPRLPREDTLDNDYQHDPSLRYQLIRVHPRSLGRNCKWLEMFEDIDVVLFCVALSDYDEYTVDSNGVSTNKMMANMHFFENIITHPTFNKKKFLLILNKFDLLEEKIEFVPLTRCEWFSDFHPVISHNHNGGNNSNNNNASLAQRAFQYIATKFKKLFSTMTGRKLFVSLITGLESDTVDEALRYAREVMMWEKWDPSFVTDHEQTSSMEEPSTY